MNKTYPFEQSPLPYEADALEPYIDRQTVQVHYNGHYKSYVDNLNAALEKSPEYQNLTLEDILKKPNDIASEVRTPIVRNAGGVYNHMHYFNGMTKDGAEGPDPDSELAKGIDDFFDSFENFQKEFSAAAAGVFGSGYACLVASPQGWLQIMTFSNQDVLPISHGYVPLLTLDVWEHSYYLKYQNKRADYIAAWWKVINWQACEKAYKEVADKLKPFSFEEMMR